jgi:hypothetical protein
MIEAIVQAAGIPVYSQAADPYTAPTPKKETLIVGGTHLLPLAHLVPKYAVNAKILVPSEIPALDREIEYGRAIQFEETTKGACQGIGFARDLGGIDSDSLDILILCSIYPAARDAFLSGAWRVVKEFGKVIVFTQSEIPHTHLASFGMAAPKYYPHEGFYVGTMRKIAAIRSRN